MQLPEAKEQDFSHLGIELKQFLLINKVILLETTFVSLAPLAQNSGVTWHSSHVRYKLSKVLWIPIEGERQIPLAERHVGTNFVAAIKFSRTTSASRLGRIDGLLKGKLTEITACIGEVP